MVVMSASKTFNLAGLATSFLVIPDKSMQEKYEKLLKTMHLTMGNIFGTVALESAFTSGDEWLDQLIVYIENNFNYLEEFIQSKLPKIKVMKPESTFLVWLDFSEYGKSDKELSAFLVEKAKLGFSPGFIFGTGGEGFSRINIGAPLSIVKEGLERLENAFKQA